ncbi:hypothetical protein FRUB_06813 [Fimbriiglobus ruber]|uniref:Uncharacterized protein n=1 Tax=Fimbriiglobus ruber TaxID=1908690 RepID=A0A225D9P3_9BACT|nr:hypothetical protein FRUB_06813 [Fimbriiglobus ruber]
MSRTASVGRPAVGPNGGVGDPRRARWEGEPFRRDGYALPSLPHHELTGVFIAINAKNTHAP